MTSSHEIYYLIKIQIKKSSTQLIPTEFWFWIPFQKGWPPGITIFFLATAQSFFCPLCICYWYSFLSVSNCMSRRLRNSYWSVFKEFLYCLGWYKVGTKITCLKRIHFENTEDRRNKIWYFCRWFDVENHSFHFKLSFYRVSKN